jgi:hypothetical protein
MKADTVHVLLSLLAIPVSTSPVANLSQQVSLKLVANLPLVSTTLVANVLKIRWFTTAVLLTPAINFTPVSTTLGVKFATGVVGTSDAPCLANIPVKKLKWRYIDITSLGKDDWFKKREAMNLVTLSL